LTKSSACYPLWAQDADVDLQWQQQLAVGGSESCQKLFVFIFRSSTLDSLLLTASEEATDVLAKKIAEFFP
jgi:hypothetical protein